VSTPHREGCQLSGTHSPGARTRPWCALPQVQDVQYNRPVCTVFFFLSFSFFVGQAKELKRLQTPLLEELNTLRQAGAVPSVHQSAHAPLALAPGRGRTAPEHWEAPWPCL